MDLYIELVNVSYEYFIIDGNRVETIIKSGTASHTYTQIQAVKDALLPTMPTGMDEMDEINWKYKEGLRYLMAQTFGLAVSDIIDA